MNPFTGDSIHPMINSLGDTLKTGVPFPVAGKVISPALVAKPKTYSVPRREQLNRTDAHPNIHIIPDALSKIPVYPDSLKAIRIKPVAINDTNHFLINSTGNKIRTGVWLPTKGKTVPFHQPQAVPASAPRYKDAATCDIQYLDVDQGISSSIILSMLEDKRGNLWFGTWGNGVDRYDGKSFTHFTEKEGLSGNKVLSVLEDKSGNIWFGTYGGGITGYDGSHLIHYTEKEGLNNNFITSILEDKNGNLWFSTEGGGVCKYHKNTASGKTGFTFYTVKEGLSSDFIMSMYEDRSRNIWFGTYDQGVIKYDGATFTHLSQKDGLSDNTILSIIEDQQGNMWFGTENGGVTKYDGSSCIHYSKKEGLSDNSVSSIHEDHAGNLWFCTKKGGVNLYNEGKSGFTHFTENEGLSINSVSCILEDQSDHLWFGTYGGGVNIYNRKSIRHFSEMDGLSNHSVRSILEDKNGNLWFGTEGGGVNMYDGESFIQITDKDGLSNNSVRAMTEDHNSNLWFGTRRGVNRYNRENQPDGRGVITQFSEYEGLSYNSVSCILEDKNGNLWFGTQGGGISMYNGKFFTHFTEKEGLSNNIVLTILEDRNGNIWFGTDGGGVTKYSPASSPQNQASFTHFTEKEGMSNNFVRTIFEDHVGNLWFGTEGSGLIIYDGEYFTHFTEKEGLSNNTIASVFEDHNYNVWVSTKGGITLFTVSDKVKNASLISSKIPIAFETFRFEKNDGLKSLDFNTNSVCLDSENRIWWGSGKSLAMLDLNKFKRKSKPPVVHLQQLDINEKFIDFRNLEKAENEKIVFNSVKDFENYPVGLVLPYDQNHLTFHFAAIDWSAPHKIKYSYVLDGLNSVWSKPDADPKADFRNLPFGHYIFKIKAIGEGGNWSEMFEYRFTINPPWWHTWWARTGYGLAALLFVAGTVRWRTTSLRKRQKELETEVNNATKEIREQRDEVKKQKEEVEKEKERSDSLLLNILPSEVAEELKETGESEARYFESVSILFTDFKEFTQIAEKLSAKELVHEINICFKAFDRICEKYGIEKIKTIGDSYMAASGLTNLSLNNSITSSESAKNLVLAAIDMQEFISNRNRQQGNSGFKMRAGIHSGAVVAGIVGFKKFQYDIWGDTVNTASRMESSGEAGKVNISRNTYLLIHNYPEFQFEDRGKIEAKGKGAIEMYFVNLAK